MPLLLAAPVATIAGSVQEYVRLRWVGSTTGLLLDMSSVYHDNCHNGKEGRNVWVR